MTTTTQTVRAIALENPASIRVFEEFGIDYCCGGHKPLGEACVAMNIAVDEVIEALQRAAAPVNGDDDWTRKPLGELAVHIVYTHHSYVRKELRRLEELAQKVVRRHGDTQAELPTIQSKVAQLGEELLQHCSKEEVVLFPYITKLERANMEGTARPHGCFGSVSSPIEMMTREHDAAETLIGEIRELSGGFTTPVGACPTYRAFYTGLHEFVQDLHQHIHLENNILFPRAITMEGAGNRSYRRGVICKWK
jgi:regulator of cell morphogenesis and NO signaling